MTARRLLRAAETAAVYALAGCMLVGWVVGRVVLGAGEEDAGDG